MVVSAKIWIFFLALDLVLTNPINQDSSSESLEITDMDSKERSFKEVTSEQGCADDNSSDCLNSSSSEEIPFKGIIPFLKSRREVLADSWQPSSSLPSYENLVEYSHAEPSSIRVGNYRSVLYPHATNLLAPYNSGYNANSLPPVVSTYIHGLVPQEEIQRTRYDLDVFSSSNLYLPRVVRQPRMLRDAEEDLLAQLRHDAIMNNIIPTMQVPFARYAAVAAASTAHGPSGLSAGASGNGAPTSSTGLSKGEISAVFSAPGVGGFPESVPILFSCTPKITRGTVRLVYPKDVSQANKLAPGYGKEAELSKGVVEKQNTPSKVDLVSKTAESKQEN